MRIAAIVSFAIACSTPAPNVEPVSAVQRPVTPTPATPIPGPAPAATPAPAPVTAEVPMAPALDPATKFVDVPALKPPVGARLMIGLRVDVPTAALSPAGDVLAIAGGTDGVQLIHVPTGRGVASRRDLACISPDPNDRGICQTGVAFAADGKRLAVWWPLSSKLVVLAVPTMKTDFEAKLDAVYALAFLDDGRLAALRNGTSYVYGVTGTRHDLVKTKNTAMRISADGRRVTVAGDSVQVLDVATGNVVAASPSQDIRLRDVTFDRQGTRWVAATSDEWQDIVTWRTGDRAVRTIGTSSAARKHINGDGVNGFSFPPPYDRVYVAMTTELLGVGLDGTPRFRSPWVTRIAPGGVVVQRHDQLTVLTGVCPLRLDGKTGNLIPGPLVCGFDPSLIAFDGGKLFAMPARTNGILTFDAKTGVLEVAQPRTDMAGPPRTSATLVAVARDPALAKKISAAFSLPGVVAGWYQISRDHKRLFISGIGIESAIIELASGRARTKLRPFVASADGSRIAIQRADGGIDIRAVENDRLIQTLPESVIAAMVLSADGTILAVEHERVVAVYDVASAKVLLEASCRGPYMGEIQLSADGRILVCDTSTAVHVYDVPRKKLARKIEHQDEDGSVGSFALSEDGRQLAIGDDNILVFDLSASVR